MSQIKIKNYSTQVEAELAKNLLEANGIKSFVQLSGLHSSGIPNDSMGADLIILEKDVDEVKIILEIK